MASIFKGADSFLFSDYFQVNFELNRAVLKAQLCHGFLLSCAELGQCSTKGGHSHWWSVAHWMLVGGAGMSIYSKWNVFMGITLVVS